MASISLPYTLENLIFAAKAANDFDASLVEDGDWIRIVNHPYLLITRDPLEEVVALTPGRADISSDQKWYSLIRFKQGYLHELDSYHFVIGDEPPTYPLDVKYVVSFPSYAVLKSVQDQAKKHYFPSPSSYILAALAHYKGYLDSFGEK